MYSELCERCNTHAKRVDCIICEDCGKIGCESCQSAVDDEKCLDCGGDEEDQ